MKGLFNTEAVKHMQYRTRTYKYDSDTIDVETELENMIAKIAELFPINEWTKNNESFYTRVIKECASLADCIKLNKKEKFFIVLVLGVITIFSIVIKYYSMHL